MAIPYPLNRYRPTRVKDSGAGGFTETLGAAHVVWGMLAIDAKETTVLVDLFEDIKVTDILGITPEGASVEARYRVTASNRVMGTNKVEFTLERITRPITP